MCHWVVQAWWNVMKQPCWLPIAILLCDWYFLLFPLRYWFFSLSVELVGPGSRALLLPAAPCQHYFTEDAPVHTEYTRNTVCTCTYKVQMQTHIGSISPLEELIRESMGPDSEQEKFPQSCEIGHTSAHACVCLCVCCACKVDVTAVGCWAPLSFEKNGPCDDPLPTCTHAAETHPTPRVAHKSTIVIDFWNSIKHITRSFNLQSWSVRAAFNFRK